MSELRQIIGQMFEAKEGDEVVIALKSPVPMFDPPPFWKFWTAPRLIQKNHITVPVRFYTVAHVEDEDGSRYSSSILAPVVVFGGGIRLALLIDGYLGVVTKDQKPNIEYLFAKEIQEYQKPTPKQTIKLSPNTYLN
jgi:hypothetical protein